MESKQFKCTICDNIQFNKEKCQCCGNEILDEYYEINHNHDESTSLMKKVVIIGGGIASMSVIRKLLKYNKCSITLITEQSQLPYYRTTIPKIIHNSSFVKNDQFFIEKEEFFKKNNVELLLNTEIIGINTRLKQVICHDSKYSMRFEKSYDDLVFATGASSNIPPFIKESTCSNLFGIRTVEDVQQIVHCLETNVVSSIAIIGAGLSGIEIAAEIRRKYPSIQIEMIEVANRILPSQLTIEASEIFTKILESNDIKLNTNCMVKRIFNSESKKRILIETNNSTIECDLVCHSCGIRPNKIIAETIGCDCNRGIIVNDQMKTSLESIYACGDCCEHNNRCYGNWSDAMKQGTVCANTIVGINDKYIHSPMPYFVYCFIGVFSVGTIEGINQFTESDSNFMQLFFDETHSYLIGGILIGKIISKIQRELIHSIANKTNREDLVSLITKWNSLF